MAIDQRPSASSHELAAGRGFTLTEVVISILLTGIIVTGTFSGILMTKKTPGLSANRATAALSERQVLDALKKYQTASVDAGAGPNPAGGSTSWTLPGDACITCTGANCGCNTLLGNCPGGVNCYALATGCVHDVTSLLPASLSAAPLNGKMCYTVTDSGGGSQENFTPQVSLTTQWTELQE